MDQKEQQLQQMQDEWMKQIDEDAKIEEMIMQASETIAGNLSLNPKITAEVNNKQYTFMFKELSNGKIRMLYMLVTDNLHFKITNGKGYRPFQVNALMDERYTLNGNLKAMVEAFIRHITGRIKPEILEEE